MLKNAIIFPQNPQKEFLCECCDYKCHKKDDMRRHFLSKKHAKCYTNAKNANFSPQTSAIPQNGITKPFQCECKKGFLHYSSLARHKKKCNFTNDKTDLSNDNILELIKQNQEFKELIIEQTRYMLEQNQKIIELSKNTNNNITNNTNNNCHNKNKFNLNFFLNEQCKDALNITDFVNDLKLQLTDLENVGMLGYTEGITKIFVNGLKKLDLHKRPLHCTDLKREVLYVKDKDAWEKENEENKKITNAINHISHKNIQQIPKWTEKHPHYKDSDSKQNDVYLQIVNQSMGSIEQSNVDKIIHNIAKEVVIEK
jgi:hypothetical protein